MEQQTNKDQNEQRDDGGLDYAIAQALIATALVSARDTRNRPHEIEEDRKVLEESGWVRKGQYEHFPADPSIQIEFNTDDPRAEKIYTALERQNIPYESHRNGNVERIRITDPAAMDRFHRANERGYHPDKTQTEATFTTRDDVLKWVKQNVVLSDEYAKQHSSYLHQKITTAIMEMPPAQQALILHGGKEIVLGSDETVNKAFSTNPDKPKCGGFFSPNENKTYIAVGKESDAPDSLSTIKRVSNHEHGHAFDWNSLGGGLEYSTNSEWKEAVAREMAWREGRTIASPITQENPFQPSIAEHLSSPLYKPADYAVETTAEMTAIYNDAYARRGGDMARVDAFMSISYPEAWPVYRDTFLPELDRMAEQLKPGYVAPKMPPRTMTERLVALMQPDLSSAIDAYAPPAANADDLQSIFARRDWGRNIVSEAYGDNARALKLADPQDYPGVESYDGMRRIDLPTASYLVVTDPTKIDGLNSAWQRKTDRPIEEPKLKRTPLKLETQVITDATVEQKYDTIVEALERPEHRTLKAALRYQYGPFDTNYQLADQVALALIDNPDSLRVTIDNYVTWVTRDPIVVSSELRQEAINYRNTPASQELLDDTSWRRNRPSASDALVEDSVVAPPQPPAEDPLQKRLDKALRDYPTLRHATMSYHPQARTTADLARNLAQDLRNDPQALDTMLHDYRTAARAAKDTITGQYNPESTNQSLAEFWAEKTPIQFTLGNREIWYHEGADDVARDIAYTVDPDLNNELQTLRQSPRPGRGDWRSNSAQFQEPIEPIPAPEPTQSAVAEATNETTIKDAGATPHSAASRTAGSAGAALGIYGLIANAQRYAQDMQAGSDAAVTSAGSALANTGAIVADIAGHGFKSGGLAVVATALDTYNAFTKGDGYALASTVGSFTGGVIGAGAGAWAGKKGGAWGAAGGGLIGALSGAYGAGAFAEYAAGDATQEWMDDRMRNRRAENIEEIRKIAERVDNGEKLKEDDLVKLTALRQDFQLDATYTQIRLSSIPQSDTAALQRQAEATAAVQGVLASLDTLIKTSPVDLTQSKTDLISGDNFDSAAAFTAFYDALPSPEQAKAMNLSPALQQLAELKQKIENGESAYENQQQYSKLYDEASLNPADRQSIRNVVEFGAEGLTIPLPGSEKPAEPTQDERIQNIIANMPQIFGSMKDTGETPGDLAKPSGQSASLGVAEGRT